jgi:hypothetical protein
VRAARAINYAIAVPTVCFMVIGWFAWSAGRQSASAPRPIAEQGDGFRNLSPLRR